MAFGKWRFSRSRKGSSGSAGSEANTNGTTTPVDEGRSYTKSQPEEPSSSSQPRLLRSLTGSFTARPQRPRKLTEKDQEYARLHKPFTKQNLEHQKILAGFEFNFGARSAAGQQGQSHSQSQRPMSICSGISPCTSRRGSAQHDNLFPPSSRTDTYGRGGSELTHKLDRLRVN